MGRGRALKGSSKAAAARVCDTWTHLVCFLLVPARAAYCCIPKREQACGWGGLREPREGSKQSCGSSYLIAAAFELLPGAFRLADLGGMGAQPRARSPLPAPLGKSSVDQRGWGL